MKSVCRAVFPTIAQLRLLIIEARKANVHDAFQRLSSPPAEHKFGKFTIIKKFFNYFPFVNKFFLHPLASGREEILFKLHHKRRKIKKLCSMQSLCIKAV